MKPKVIPFGIYFFLLTALIGNAHAVKPSTPWIIDASVQQVDTQHVELSYSVTSKTAIAQLSIDVKKENLQLVQGNEKIVVSTKQGETLEFHIQYRLLSNIEETKLKIVTQAEIGGVTISRVKSVVFGGKQSNAKIESPTYQLKAGAQEYPGYKR